MSKSVLIIDTPKNCDKCPLCYHEHSMDYLSKPKTSTYCIANGDNMCKEIDAETKPDWCPLISFIPPSPHKFSNMQCGMIDIYNALQKETQKGKKR